MSSRALVKIFDFDEKLLCKIYVMQNGYIETLGLELAQFINNHMIAYGGEKDDKKCCVVGMNNFACRLIKFITEFEPKYTRLYQPKNKEKNYEDCIFEIKVNKKNVSIKNVKEMKKYEINIKIFEYDEVIYDGFADGLINKIKNSWS